MASNTKIIITPTDQLIKVYFDATPITVARVQELVNRIQEVKEYYEISGIKPIYLYEDDALNCISINNAQFGIHLEFQTDGEQEPIEYEVYNQAAGGHQPGVWFRVGTGEEVSGEIEINIGAQSPGKEEEESQQILKVINAIFAEYVYEKDTVLSHKTIIPEDAASILYFNAKRLTATQIKNIYDYITENGSEYSMSGSGHSMMLYSNADTAMAGNQIYAEAVSFGPGIDNSNADYQTIAEHTGPIYIATDVVGIDTSEWEEAEITVESGREQEANSIAINTQDLGEGSWTIVTCYYDGTKYYAVPSDVIKWTSATINQQGLTTYQSYGGGIVNDTVYCLGVTFLEPVDPEAGKGGIKAVYAIVDKNFQGKQAGVWYDTVIGTIITGETCYEIDTPAAGKIAVDDGEGVPVWAITTAQNSALQDIFYEKRTADTHCLTVAGSHCIVYPSEAYLTQDETLEIQVVPETDYATSSISLSRTGQCDVSFSAGDNTVGVSNLTGDVTITVNCTTGPGPGPSTFAFTTDGVNCTIEPDSGTYTQGETTVLQVTPASGYIFDDRVLVEHTGEILSPVIDYSNATVSIAGASTDFTITVTCYEAPVTHFFQASGTHCTVLPAQGEVVEGTATAIAVTADDGYVFDENSTINIQTAGRVEYTRTPLGIMITSATSNFILTVECQPETPFDPSNFKLIYEKNGHLYGSTTGFVSEDDVEFALYNSTETELILGEGHQTSGECQLKNGYKVLYDSGARILKASTGIPASSDTTIKYKEV